MVVGSDGERARPFRALRAALAAACASALIAGCPGSDATPGGDAGPRDDGGTSGGRFSIAPPAPPAPPNGAPAPAALPVLTPCAPGWREVPGDPTTCDPFAGAPMTRCADDELRAPGEPACVRIGPVCPTDGWPEGVPASGVRFVRAGAAAGGTGDRAAPFARMTDALAGATTGTVIAIAPGTYDEIVFVPAGVTLWGACVSGVRIASTTASRVSSTVVVGGADITIRNVSIGGSGQGITVGRGASVTLEDVVTVGATARAWSVHTGGRVVGRRVAIRDTRLLSIGEEGHAIYAESGAQVELTHASIERNADNAIIAFDAGTTISLADSVVRDTAPRTSDGRFGRGVNAEGGVAVTIVRSVFERNHGIAVFGANAADVRISDSVIRDTDSAMTMGGRGVSVQAASSLSLERVVLTGNRSYALYASGGSTVTLDDVVMRETRTDVSGLLGRGGEVRGGTSLVVHRVLVDRMHDMGMLVLDTDTHATLEDLIVRDTTPDDHGTNGRGIEVSGGASADGARVRLERNADLGLGCFGSAADGLHSAVDLVDVVVLDQGTGDVEVGMGRGVYVLDDCTARIVRATIANSREIGVGAAIAPASLVLEDATVSDTRPTALGMLGRGVNVQQGARAEVRRVVVERNRETSVEVREGAVLEAEDLVIRETAQSTAIGSPGRGLAVEDGATATVTRMLVERSHECGVLVLEPGSSATLSDVVVRDTLPRETEQDFGIAMVIETGASAVIERAVLENGSTGLFTDGAGTSVTLRDLIVRDIEGRPLDGMGGSAVIAQAGSMVTLERALFERTREAATIAYGAGTRVVGRTVDVVDTRARTCATSTCRQFPAGIGIGAYDDGTADFTDFRVSRAALCGVHVARGGAIDLRDGEVSQSPIGANVQTAGFDVRRVTDGVRYRDNARNVVADTLPVPDTTVPPVTGVAASP